MARDKLRNCILLHRNKNSGFILESGAGLLQIILLTAIAEFKRAVLLFAGCGLSSLDDLRAFAFGHLLDHLTDISADDLLDIFIAFADRIMGRSVFVFLSVR